MKTFFAAALASAAALANASSVGLSRVQANFDDITVADPGLSLQPIGVYDGLNWNGFDVINVGLALTGVAPQSSPNVALQYILSESAGSTATLKPASSKVIYFALQSFYFGCVASTEESVTGLPIACTLTLTGKRSGKTVVTQNISFSPQSALLSPMKRVTFAGAWSNVDEVDFTQTGALAAATGVLYDNFQYTTFTKA